MIRLKIKLLLVAALATAIPVAAQTTLYWSEDDGSGFTAYLGSSGTWELTSMTSLPRWATNLGTPAVTDLGGWINGAIATFSSGGGSGAVRTLTLDDNLSVGGFFSNIAGVTIADGGGKALTLTGAAPEFYLFYRRSLTLNVPLVGSAGFKLTHSGSVRLNAASPSLSGNVETGPGGIYVGHQEALGTASVDIGVASYPSGTTESHLIFDAPAAASFEFTFANPITFLYPSGGPFVSAPPRIMVERAMVSSVYENRSATLTGTLTLANDATLAAGGTSTNTISRGALDTSTRLIVSGNISETGGSYRPLIEGDVTLSGTNSFTGRILVGDHAHARLTVSVFNDEGSAGPLGAGTGILLGMRYENEGYSYSRGEVNYTGGTASSNRTIQIDPGATGTITVANAPAALTLSGVISNNAAGNVNFKKDGPGTLNLTAANTYSGATTVLAGTLLVNNTTGSGVGTGTLTVKNGATLGGAGFIDSAATIEAGAHLAPGNSPGTITFTNGLTLGSGSVLDFQLGSSSDRIDVTGGLLTGPAGLGGITLNLFDAGGFTPATYVLFDFTGATLSDFDPDDFALGNTISGYNYSFALNGNLLELTAVTAIPEPSTYAMIAGLATLGLAVWRRRWVGSAPARTIGRPDKVSLS